ncbi:hypothetical protein [Rummeliibacillus pycnus]|uniref:hypothetical protein n=1 Tax=Rummeliibacillus pycnus TaxID=101070 RepID=UPI003D298456
MKWLKWIGLSLLFLVLTGCMDPNHSVQTGTIDQKSVVQFNKSEKSEETYQKGIDTFNNGRNIKVVPSEIENLKTYYIQFKDDNQNLVISNYKVWFDYNKDRIIFTDYIHSYSYYRIVDDDTEFIRSLFLNDDEGK